MRHSAGLYTMKVMIDETGRVVSRQYSATYLDTSGAGEATEEISQQAYSYARSHRPELCEVAVIVPSSVTVEVK